MALRSLFLSLLSLTLLGVPLSASAAPTAFSAQLLVFLGDGAGGLNANSSNFVFGSYTGAGLPIQLGSGLFTANRFDPIATGIGGAAPLPTAPNSLYVLGNVINRSSQAGSFNAGQGPAGGFGGTLGLGMSWATPIGLSPIPGVDFGALTHSVPVGSSATNIFLGSVIGVPITVSAVGQRWTTGTITFGAGLPTSGTAMGFFFTVTSLTGPPPLIRRLSLVTPILVRVPGAPQLSQAGYASLYIETIPEPGTAVLVACASLSLVAWGRSRRRD